MPSRRTRYATPPPATGDFDRRGGVTYEHKKVSKRRDSLISPVRKLRRFQPICGECAFLFTSEARRSRRPAPIVGLDREPNHLVTRCRSADYFQPPATAERRVLASCGWRRQPCL